MDVTFNEKVGAALKRLKTFAPEEGYFVAFSGGKDSQCIYHLCELAGVKFDAHYSVTSVDPPELVRFIKQQYPKVKMEIPHDKDGNPITMWNLIPRKLMPPTRLSRYCCEKMKECSGQERVTVTGVRWAESVARKNSQGVVVVQAKIKDTLRKAESLGIDFIQTAKGGLVLNDDNDLSRRMVEQCYRTRKTLVNPIVDWTEDDVWKFLKCVDQESCYLYSEGWHRLGCIGCPMATKRERERELSRWPKYNEAYLRAFARMLEERKKRELPTNWRSPEEVMDWWVERNVLPGQMKLNAFMEE